MDCTMLRRGLVGALAAVVTGVLIGPASADAATQAYAPGQKAKTFNGGPGGWQATDSQAGPLGETLCIVAGVLVCPSATSTHAPDGGVSGDAGDGYLNANFGVIVGVSGSGTSVYESRPFVYNGVGGQTARKVTFRMKRRANLTQLLALPDSSASYTAELVRDGGPPIDLSAGALPASSDWTKVAAPVGSLRKGRTYAIRITSRFETGVAGVIEEGDVSYDNVALLAKRGKGSSNGGGGNDQFARQFRQGLGPAVEQGNRLRVKVRCPKSAAPNRCKFRLAAKLQRSGKTVAGPRKARAQARQRKFVALHVKPAFRDKVANRNRVFIKAKVTAGSRTMKVTKRVRVRH